jgi:hypothetical protein
MSKGNDSASYRDFERETKRVDRTPAIPNPLGLRSDPLSSEDIDARIRWFFENAREPKASHP